MANWKTTVNIKNLHAAFRAGTITVQKMAVGVAARLKKNRFAEEWAMLDIIDCFEALAEEPKATVEDYDSILAELYDFADDDHRIWVKTF